MVHYNTERILEQFFKKVISTNVGVKELRHNLVSLTRTVESHALSIEPLNEGWSTLIPKCNKVLKLSYMRKTLKLITLCPSWEMKLKKGHIQRREGRDCVGKHNIRKGHWISWSRKNESYFEISSTNNTQRGEKISWSCRILSEVRQ